MGFSRQEYWSGLTFPFLVNHVLSELFTVTCLSWVALHSMTHSFIELRKPFCHNKTVIHKRDEVKKVKSEVSQSCLSLWDPMDYSLRGSSVHGIFQARVLEWGAIAFSPIILSKDQTPPLRGLAPPHQTSPASALLLTSLHPCGLSQTL